MMMLGCQWIIIFMAGLDSNCLDHLLENDDFKSILFLTKDCVFDNGKKESAGHASLS